MIFDRILSSKFKNRKIPKILFAVSIMAGIFFLALRAPADPDLFWHLKTGELMWQYGIMPDSDWFSYTMSDYQRAEFEWLSEILMFFIWKIAGLGGLAIFFALVVTSAFGYFIPNSIARHPFFLTRFLAIMGAFVSSLTFGSRPQMFSILGAALLFFIIAKHKQNPQSQIAWMLPIVFLLWANMHGGFVFGVGLMVIFLALENFLIKQKDRAPSADWIKLYDPLSREGWKKISNLFAISVPLTFLNPYGWRVYQEVYRATTDTYDKNNIIEWLAPNFHTTEGIIFGFYVIFVFIVMAMIKKIDLLSFVLVPFLMFFAFQAGRNIPFFVIVSLPFLVKSLAELENVFSGIFQKKFIAVAISGFLIFYLPFAAKTADVVKTFNNSEEFAKAGEYPDKALRFLMNNPDYLKENIFNSYGWGGYIIGSAKCNPPAGGAKTEIVCEPKVFIDGRMSYWKLPDRHILKDYIDISSASDNWKDLIDKYRVRIIFIDKKTFLGKVLELDSGWKKLYGDDTALIYEKK